MDRSRFRPLHYLSLLLSSCLLSSSCANSESYSPTPLRLNISLPSYPNKRISAYLFVEGNLTGVVRSNVLTDSTGAVSVIPAAVDRNNCSTGDPMVMVSGVYYFHLRIDSLGSSSYVYPNGCSSDFGFLSTANLGYFTSVNLDKNEGRYFIFQSYLNTTNTIQFNFTSTGLNAVNRYTYCSIFDGLVQNPTISLGTTLGYSQGSVGYTIGAGSATTTATFAVPAVGVSYKYACWIDANNSGTYNTGDLIASGTATMTTTVSSWQTVP